MGIDKHLILTLERSKTRQWAMLGGCTAMQTPIEKIRFIEGHDNLDYDDDMKKVARAADADGFPYAEYFARGLKNEVIGQSASGVCQVWNLSRILRYIANGTETCIITWDDRILTLPFEWIDRITTELQSRKEEFYFFQLRVRIGDAITDNERICKCYPELLEGADEYLKLMKKSFDVFDEVLNEKWDLDFEQFIESQYEDYSLLESKPKTYINKYIQKNRLGYDESMVISPKGAAWLLIQAFDMEDIRDEYEPKDMPYWDIVLHRRNTFDSWMIKDLDIPVQNAIELDKGIYCPKEIGYKYIHDWMFMGSDVEWTNLGNPTMESLRKRNTEIELLEIE